MDISEWEDLMPHTVTIEPWASQDQYLNDTYGAAVTYRARVQGKAKLITAVDGEQKVSTVQVYIAGLGVTARDRITLPAPFSPTQPSILAVGHISDESGGHHTVVYT